MEKGTCSFDGCPRPVLCKDYCTGHYKRWKKTGSPGTTQIAGRTRYESGQLCAAPKCRNAAQSRGLCDTHAHRLKVHGDIQADVPVKGKHRGAKPCKFEGCPELAKGGRGWCHTHFRRWLTHGDPAANFARKVKPCKFVTCDRMADGHGMCSVHRERVRRTGDARPDIPIVGNGGWHPPRQPCATDGCDEPARVRGHCRNHYTAIRLAEIKADPERLAAYKAYHHRHHKAYVNANRDRLRLLHRLWQMANPSKRREGDRRRYERVKAAPTIPFTLEQFTARMAYFGNRCWMCGGPFESTDHVKPLAKGGYHCLSNLRPACKADNSAKKDRWPYPTAMAA